jgi:hypothetical protein
MATNPLPLIALAGAAFFLMKGKGGASGPPDDVSYSGVPVQNAFKADTNLPLVQTLADMRAWEAELDKRAAISGFPIFGAKRHSASAEELYTQYKTAVATMPSLYGLATYEDRASEAFMEETKSSGKSEEIMENLFGVGGQEYIQLDLVAGLGGMNLRPAGGKIMSLVILAVFNTPEQEATHGAELDQYLDEVKGLMDQGEFELGDLQDKVELVYEYSNLQDPDLQTKIGAP